MNLQDAKRQMMLRYILGEMLEEERSSFEEKYFDNDLFFEEFLIAEDELIDGYVRGSLSSYEKDRFENYFLASPKHRERVEFAETLMKSLAKPQQTSPLEHQKSIPWSESLRNLFFPQSSRLKWSFAFSAAAVLIGLWAINRNIEPQTDLKDIQPEKIVLRKQEELIQQADKEHSPSEELSAEPKHERRRKEEHKERSFQQKANPSPSILSFILNSGSIRGNDQSKIDHKKLKEVDFVELRLNLKPGDEYKSYQAKIEIVGGKIIRRQTNLRAESIDTETKAVFFRIRAKLLVKGDYMLTLTGLPPNPDSEEDYHFSVVENH